MRIRGILVWVVLIVAGSAMLEAVEELPFDRKGLQESGYSLSQFENISLSDGNLSFVIPLASLKTDGGLEYKLNAYYNSKHWYEHRYCDSIGDDGFNSCEGVEAGGEIVSARIADGLEAYGFGWDMRPWRIQTVRLDDSNETLALFDPSGARHLLQTTPPWSTTSPADYVYTGDGSNFRIEILERDAANRWTRARMEDGHGKVYIFEHIVPESCNADLSGLNPDLTNLDDFNFHIEVSGLYLTEIQSGPWTAGVEGGEPANSIEFTYQATASGYDDQTCGQQPLLASITAHGEQDRTVSFNYTTLGDPGQEVTVLDSITVPAFDPTLGGQDASAVTASIDWVSTLQDFKQFNVVDSQEHQISFSAPGLVSVTLPEDRSFTFTQNERAFLETVELPSGARIDYTEGRYPVGLGRWYDPGGPGPRVEDPHYRFCGAKAPGLGSSAQHPDINVRSWGIKTRTISYSDSSTGDTSSRQETTWFLQALNCVGKAGFDDNGSNSQWPYNFDPFLRDDNHLMTEYLYTLVFSQPGGPALASEGDILNAEIHRFHPLTREEFSDDQVEGSGVYAFAVTASGDNAREPFGENGIDLRVLRHREREKAVLPGHEDKKNLEPWESRYVFETQTRTFTDLSNSPDQQDVKTCYPMVTPNETNPPDISCAEVRKTTLPGDVDEYLNPKVTTIQTHSFPPGYPGAITGTRTITNSYVYDDGADTSAEDSYVWALGLKVYETVTEGSTSVTTGFGWRNLSVDDSNIQHDFVLSAKTINPSDARAGGWSPLSVECAEDCVRHDYFYDDGLGNLTRDEVSGGYTSGGPMPSLSVTTRSTYRYGGVIAKELVDGSGETLLLWEREIDPATGLPRWHVNGSGFGFAYLWDEAGRVTDIAPIDGHLSDIQPARTHNWDLSHQTTSEPTLGTPVKGLHVEYFLPSESSSGLLEHRLYDVTWNGGPLDQALTPGSIGVSSPRSIYVFDGLGRLTQEIEKYLPHTETKDATTADLNYRSRYHLSFMHKASAPQNVLCDEIHSWDLTDKSRVKLDSEWVAGDGFPGCPAEATWSDWTESQLDGLNRPALIHQPDGMDIKTSYSGDTKSTTTEKIATDLSGSTQQAVLEDISTISYSDPFGRLVRLEEELGAGSFYRTDYEYDPADRLTKISLWNPQQTGAQERSFTYSDGGFLTAQVEPERSVNYLSYDALGHPLSWQTVGSPDAFSSVYDGFGRLKSTSLGSDLVSKQVWGDTTAGGGTGISYPSYNQIVESTRHNRFGNDDVPVTERFEYNGPAGQISGKKLQIGGFGTGDDGFQLNYGYDAWGNQARVYFPFFAGCRYSDWESLKRSFDGSWLESVSLSSTPEAGYPDKAIGAFNYHPSGRVARESYGEGISHWDETADPSGMARPAEISITIGGAKAPLPGLGPMKYDGAGNIWALGNRRYAYDGLSRLTTHLRDGDPVSGWTNWGSYDYDRWGNLTRIERLDLAKATDILTFHFALDANGVPQNNRVDSLSDSKAAVSLYWDGRGNLSEQQAFGALRHKHYEWSGDDRLMESTDNPGPSETTWRYAYDAAGERVLKWGDLGSGIEGTAYIRDESGRVISEWDLLSGGSGFDVNRDYLYGAGREIAEIGQGANRDELLFIGIDHLGSTRATFDQSGLPENRKYPDYYPFGMLRDESDAETTHLFTGHERDLGTGSSGLDYLHQRFYSPILGRFISVDPVMGDTGSSQSANRYSYVENNPLKLVDPDGREGIGALVGFAGGAVKAAFENIKIATQRPVSNKELFQNLIANLAGGTLTGATAGLGSGVVGGAAMGGIGGGLGGAFKRGIDPASMNTKAMDREALKADVLGGAAGGALGGLAKGGSQLAQAGKVEAANIEAMAARAVAAEDRTLVALAHEANKNAAVVAQQTLDNAETIGAVAGTMIAEGVAKKISKSQAEKETN